MNKASRSQVWCQSERERDNSAVVSVSLPSSGYAEGTVGGAGIGGGREGEAVATRDRPGREACGCGGV